MATMPIEVIVQDAEAPIVPSEDGANTNTNTEATVAVPDTGSEMGNIFTGSASSSILPAILLVLAIGSIVAILIHKYHKQKKNKTSKKEKLATTAASSIAILAATVLVGNLILPATKAATSDVADGIVPAEDKVSIVVTRDGDSAEASIESTATITSTSDFGYKVLLSMAEGVETANLYLDGDEDSEYYIAATESTILTDNTWGYALTEDGEYNAVPLVDDAATATKEIAKAEIEELDIYYGVNVDKDLPVGMYSGEIEYALKPAIEYMQDFATLSAGEKTSVLALMVQDRQYQLTDNRDQTMYYIAKLADGKCWMTQNLDLDLKTDGIITYDSTNTNLTVAGSGAYENGYTTQDGVITWTPANATIDFTGSSVGGWSNSDTVPYSANPGDVYYYTSGSDENDIQYNSLAECVAANHTAEDCKHYHAGNYYNWSAAVASNDSSSLTAQYENAANSICPAGWRLPLGPNSEEHYYNGLSNLAISYPGILTELTRGCGGGCLVHEYLSDGFNDIRTNPLWYVRSGGVGYNAMIQDAASVGYYWTNTAISNYAVRLKFNRTSVDPSDSYGRSQGYSVRCVAE